MTYVSMVSIPFVMLGGIIMTRISNISGDGKDEKDPY